MFLPAFDKSASGVIAFAAAQYPYIIIIKIAILYFCPVVDQICAEGGGYETEETYAEEGFVAAPRLYSHNKNRY